MQVSVFHKIPDVPVSNMPGPNILGSKKTKMFRS